MQLLRAAARTRYTRDAQAALERRGVIRPVRLAKVRSIRGSEADALGTAGESEEGELQARVTSQHGLAASIEALEEGEADTGSSGAAARGAEDSRAQARAAAALPGEACQDASALSMTSKPDRCP
jgi:hypothetical protein